MAKFIEIPHGVGNPETGGTDRAVMLVNIEQIISIAPYGDYMTSVTLKGGRTFKAFRKYSTLCSMLTNKGADLFEVFPDEEITAAFASGYEKAKTEIAEDITKAKKDFIDKAVEWLSENPLIDSWRSKFRKDMLK